ncbi:uncharacterized protein At5g19025-like isoform X2 [Andrographis paniculata]|uniref:uncharacterized protein At5g19025-like isoform X2 n=1 Tax=Andrographis paniculata TaxID=175694 RepID=UPI0021E943AB|nr:uncharacterized protein At5g19025-like isoform X2 [Andrographis paniculata]
MVYFDRSVSVEQHVGMTKSVNSTNSCLKLKRINQNRRTSFSLPNHLNIPACEQSRYAIIDVVILIAVIGACGFLFYPYARILGHKTIELGVEVLNAVGEELVRAPMVFACLGLAIIFASMALVAILVWADRKCGRPDCQGLRAAAEFDIQLETEETVKKSNSLTKTVLKKGLFELPLDHNKELEAELKQMAPPNGRAILIFRARCGCPVGRLEVPGHRKPRKVKNHHSSPQIVRTRNQIRTRPAGQRGGPSILRSPPAS